MIVIQAKDITVNFGDQNILNSVSLAVNEGERVGIIGVNGSGKTTLLKCLAGQLEPDQGNIIKSGMVTVGYLEQLPDIEADVSAWDIVMSGFADLIALRERLRSLEVRMSTAGADLDRLMDLYARITEEYEQSGGYACENLARRILVGLGFSPEEFSMPVKNFSGGQKTRINMGRLLAQSPDIVLLDEPTNYLDMSSVEWLQEYLQSYPGTVITVSHDRMLLENIATKIVEVRHASLFSFNGNYSEYLKKREADDLARQRAYEKQQEHIKKTEEYIARFKAGIKARQARGRQSQLERLERIEQLPMTGSIGNWQVPLRRESGHDVLKLQGITKSFGGQILFNNIDLAIYKGDKIALIGPNGCGKTTLLRIINGMITADEGKVQIGSRVDKAYFSQEFEDLDENNTVLDEIVYNCNVKVEEARNVLGRMLFSGDAVFKQIANLSGGERARLVLLKMILSGANFLIMDEPTNHLDINSRQAMEELLADYPGTILVVSHDRYFVDQVAERVVAFEGRNLEQYQGNYTYYMQKLKEKQKAIDYGNKVVKQEKSRYTKIQLLERKNKQEQKRMQRELDELEKQISILEEEKTKLESILTKPEVYSNEEQSRFYTGEYRDTEERLNTAYERWEGLVEKIEIFADKDKVENLNK